MMVPLAPLAAFTLLVGPGPGAHLLDDFATISAWSPAPADGVGMHLARANGRRPTTGALRIDFDFHGRGGWATARRPFAIDLPDNYAFTFYVKGHAQPNTLQFKMLDSTGTNVWWWARPEMVFTSSWTKVIIRRRRVSFAFGPISGGEMRPGGPVLRHVAAIEIALAPGTGGRGSISITDLSLTPLPPVADSTAPHVTTTKTTATLDFGVLHELGGLDIAWDSTNRTRPMSYAVELSDDGRTWRLARYVAHAHPGHASHDYLVLPDAIARAVRVTHASATIAGVRAEPPSFADSVAGRFAMLARAAPPGAYPRYLHGTQPYWTVFGSRHGTHTGLLDTDGNADFGAGTPGIEPFVLDHDHVISWADVRAEASLEGGDLPFPTLTWHTDAWSLAITGFGVRDSLGLRYRLTNTSTNPITVTLLLAFRPFQVDPPWQSLNVAGGPTPVRTLDPLAFRPSQPPTMVGATTFLDGDITEYLWHGHVPPTRAVHDPDAYASGAMAFGIHLAPGQHRDLFLGARDLDGARSEWSSTLVLDGPPPVDALARAIRTSISYILIDARRYELRPGPRSYARSWIRDGALMSDALLRTGDTTTVRRFIAWFAPYQFPSGRVPCCVDIHGADPVPELDSDGELIALIAEYYAYTRDTSLARWGWPYVVKAVADMDSLRHSDTLGLLPRSISHEGYTAAPQHSVWDDCFALKGYSDAAALAPLRRARPERFLAAHDTLSARLNEAIAKTGDFVPGAIDLDDFDATSTAIGMSPTECALPPAQLRRTFAMYDSLFALRLAGRIPAYTPYEFRDAGALLRLGDRAHAWPVIAAGLGDLHPAAWNAWPEVVFRDTVAPNVIGDRPHGWVAAEFVRAVLDLFAYAANHDSTLVLGAGVQRAWLSPGIRVAGLHTPFGVLSYREWDDHGTVRLHVDAGLRVPPDGIIVDEPVGAGDRRVTVRALPADVSFP